MLGLQIPLLSTLANIYPQYHTYFQFLQIPFSFRVLLYLKLSHVKSPSQQLLSIVSFYIFEFILKYEKEGQL